MLHGSIASVLCQVAVGDGSQARLADMVDKEFAETGTVRLKLKAHLHYEDNRVYFWDVIHVKSCRVAWKTWA